MILGLNTEILILLLTVVFLATFIRSAFGFGEALIAVPLLALIMPVEIAAPVAVLVSITVSVFALAQDRRHVNFRSAGLLFASTCLGIPLGLYLLFAVPEAAVKSVLAIVIIVFSVFCLLNKTQMTLKSDKLAPVFGFVAGILGGAYGMNGPPLVAFGTLRRWPPQQFRATLQAYFLPASIVVMFAYWAADLWVPAVSHYYLLTLPVVVFAIFTGRAANKRFDSQTFIVCVHFGLIAVGAALLWQAYV